MTFFEFIDSIDNWSQGHREKIIADYEKGMASGRATFRCSGMRDMGTHADGYVWFHQENVWVDREGNIVERLPGPEDPIHFGGERL